MGRSKRGQNSANSAAIVIILIAVMIILYILFLPPAERAALLGEEAGPGGTGGNGGTVGKTLVMSKNPGRVYPAGNNLVEHKVPSFLVYTATNADELKRTESLYIRNSAFSSKKGEVLFYYDQATTKDVRLSFNVITHSGRLRVTLNGYEVFEGEVMEGSPQPLTLPAERMQQKNTLIFETSSPGMIFWKIHEYQLDSIVVSGTVTNYQGAVSEQHFSISDIEYEKMEKALLEFLPDCPPHEQGQLQVLINKRPIYSSMPDCGIKASIEVSREFLRPGDNSLIATTDSGSFLLDAPKVTVFMKQESQPVFYFTATPNLLDAIYSGRRGLLLSLRFADSTSTKRGVVEINGFKTSFDTQNYIYQTPLDPESILDGSNGVKIVPVSGPMDIVELRIEVI